MNVTHLLSLAEHAVSRAGRPATAIAHDCEDARSVVFRITPGQEVAAHTSPSSVALVVLDGMGTVTGATGERIVSRGDLITYEPNEPHAMRAMSGPLVLLALITPRPGVRQAAEPVALAHAG